MKKILAVMLALALVLGLCAFANAESADVSAMTVTSPGGAPALALAAMAAENPENYQYIAADEIAGAFAKAEADFIIAPINAGAKLFKAGKSTYKLAAVVSWGNLYIASQQEGLKAEDLSGKKLTLFGENTINASVVLYALKENGIEPAETEYLAGADLTKELLLNDAEAIVVTAEPALTAAKIAAKQNGKAISSISVNDLLKQAAGMDGYTQAALFVKAETLEAQPEAVAAFLKQAEEACGKCTTDIEAVAEAAEKLEILKSAKVAQQAIPGCAIRFVAAAEAREMIERTAQIDLSQFGGELPPDDFYYGAE